MRAIIAPNEHSGTQTHTVFLAGGITGCPDWQAEITRKLVGVASAVYNPRRKNFDITDPNATLEQIKWEHRYIRKAEVVVFWFCAETDCPITLYELGAVSMMDKPIIIGIEPGYRRTQDVIVQTSLIRPLVPIVHSLDELVEQVYNL